MHNIEYNAFQVYKDYIFLKRHFQEYDFIWNENAQYKGSIQKLNNRKDLYFFKKAYKEFATRNECIQYFISAFLYDNNIWIGDIFNESVEQYHQNRMKVFSRLEYVFETDCEKVQEFLEKYHISLETAFLTKGIKDCIILTIPEISLESLCLFHHFNQWANLWFPIHPIKKQRRFYIYKYLYQLRLNERNFDKMKSCYHQLVQS
jgi:hypothetical protein